jgi:cell division protein FtsI/penicillin-binding protein 2
MMHESRHPPDPRSIEQNIRILRFGRVFCALILLTLGVSLLRVVQLKVDPGEKLEAYLVPPTSTQRELGRRGDIVDSRGRVLATSVVGYRLFVDPQISSDLERLALELAPCTGLHPQEILQQIAARPGSRYVVLDRELEDWQVDAIRQRLASKESGLKGVGIEPHLFRLYPHGEVAASVVGFVGIDHQGLAGVESRLEKELSPRTGSLVYERDAAGRVLWIDEARYRPKQDGLDLRLTFDLVIQEFVEETLEEATREFNARGARCVVMDVQTGEILALVDVLRDRKGFIEVISDAERRSHRALGRQRCTSDPFEPGSTFKPFIWASALELGKARPETRLPLPGGLYRTSKGRPIRDVGSYGDVDFELVLIKSLNSGMAWIGERFTSKELRDRVLAFGFGQSTECGLPGETKGLVTSPRNWNHHTQTSVPMGQEIAVTLVQMVRAFSAFCRDGTMVEPHILVRSEEARRSVVPRRAISEPVALRTREAMRKGIVEGTGKKANSELYEVFGKTGTPQLPIPKALEKRIGRKGYFEDRYIANFIGGAPYRNPRIVVYLTIDDPDRRKQHFGGMTAAPTARKIIDFTLAYLGVEPDAPPAAPVVALRENRGASAAPSP